MTTWIHPTPEVERVQLDTRSWVDVVRGLVRDAMESAAELQVPLAVAVSTGANWLSAH